MKVRRQSIFDCSAEAAWAEVQKLELLEEVCRPLITFRTRPGDEAPERWEAGETFHIRSYLFGILPLGLRTLYFERVDHDRRELQTRERDALVRRWDHTIRIRDAGEGRAAYSDEIEIEAGIFTLPVWLFAWWFYRHRHRRWRRLARRLGKIRLRETIQ